MSFFKSLIRSVYKILLPKYVRKHVWHFRDKIEAENLKNRILQYYNNNSTGSLLYKKELDYLRVNKISVMPYKDINEIDINVEIFFDGEIGLYYTIFEQGKMYFKRSMKKNQIVEYFKGIVKEQFVNSPHRYLSGQFNVGEGDVVFDIGAAEGNFALSVVNKASFIYLFEPDDEWAEALKYTFEKWKDKVQIVPKFVSNTSEFNSISIDDFVKKNKISVNFIKVDVDGEEFNLLNGMKNLLKTSSLNKIAICSYHNQFDEKLLSDFLIINNYNVQTSDRYMLFIYDKNISPPYFRKGVLRASLKSNNL